MKYDVGDRVRMKKAIPGHRDYMAGEIATISHIIETGLGYKCYRLVEDKCDWPWDDTMIECKVEDEMKSEDELLDKYEELIDRAFKGGYEKCKSDIELNGFQLPEGYIFKDENGKEILTSKIILEKLEPKYPKTYKLCLAMTTYDKEERLLHVLDKFKQLLICRDAYWKIAGEEMGLDKPWEPDWRKKRYIIYRNQDAIIGGYREAGDAEHHIFEFPTKEMRDAFRENFGPDMEICKDFL